MNDPNDPTNQPLTSGGWPLITDPVGGQYSAVIPAIRQTFDTTSRTSGFDLEAPQRAFDNAANESINAKATKAGGLQLSIPYDYRPKTPVVLWQEEGGTKRIVYTPTGYAFAETLTKDALGEKCWIPTKMDDVVPRMLAWMWLALRGTQK